MILFGLINIFWYLPISLGITLDNHPFPFQYLEGVTSEHGGHGMLITYSPIDSAIANPYWLFWSLSLYGGIVILAIVGIREFRK